jgi:hypothetical protein
MKKKTISIMFMSVILASLFVVPVLADPPEKVDGFVCPVLGGKAGMDGKSQKIEAIAGGYYTVAGPEVIVPEHATNDGFPSVADSFNVPSEEGYTEIWNYENAPE